MLHVRDLGRSFGSRGSQVVALDRLTLAIPDGQLACVVGPSGCGKSTLLRCVTGLTRPTSGTVTFDGRAVTGPPAGMGVVFQDYGRSLFAWRTVRANVALGLHHERPSRTERRERIDAAVASVGLGDRGDAYPWQLSGGMQQRVAIARAIVARPRVLVMDEPFAAVDAQTRESLEDLVRALWQELNMTVLFVTHDIDEAVYMGQRVVVLGTPPGSLRADVPIDLPADRDQVRTKALPAFVALRTRLHEELRRASRPTTHDAASTPDVPDYPPTGLELPGPAPASLDKGR